MLLTQNDLHALTGYIRASAQRRWLDRQGMRYAVRRDGAVSITWQQVESGLNRRHNQVAEPDFAAIIR